MNHLEWQRAYVDYLVAAGFCRSAAFQALMLEYRGQIDTSLDPEREADALLLKRGHRAPGPETAA